MASSIAFAMRLKTLHPDPTVAWCLVALLGAIALAAITSRGFYFYDEHYQILEFSHVLLGRAPAADLPWEYFHRIRSWFQPTLLALPLGLCDLVGLRDPHIQAAVARFVSGMISWGAFVALARMLPRTAALATLSFWFVPYLSVRTASETLGGALFVVACGVYMSRWKYRAAASGILLGLSVLARFQMVIAAAALVGWLFVYKRRIAFVAWRPFLLGGASSLLFGLVLDRIGYGVWTFSMWNYVSTNLVQGISAEVFGTEPWWKYWNWMSDLLWPLGLMIAICFVVFWARFRRDPLTWCTFAFVLVHSVTAHKEFRFLFPLFFVVGAVVSQSLRWHTPRWLIGLFVAFQVGAHFVLTTDSRPTHLPLLRTVSNDPEKLPLVSEPSPVKGIGNGFKFLTHLKTNFYNPDSRPEYVWPPPPDLKRFWAIVSSPELIESQGFSTRCRFEARSQTFSLWQCG